MLLHSSANIWMFVVFLLVIVPVLALDLGVFHRKEHKVSVKEATAWTTVWISLALLFNVGLYVWFRSQLGHKVAMTKALEFFTGYLIEYALSVDNLFVFIVIFSYFSVPAAYQHRVLFWGIVGAAITRALFIVVGATLLQTFHWLLVIFGVFLVFTGLKILLQKSEEVHPEKNPLIGLFRKLVPMVPAYHGARFVVRVDKKWLATPLLLVLCVVEGTDIVFAIDSIPAIFGITQDPFIVFTSNIFAILGLRSLFFLLSRMIDKFHYLKIGLGLVLTFIGIKMVGKDLGSLWSGFEPYEFDVKTHFSLLIVLFLLGGSVLASLLFPPKHAPLPTHEHKGSPAPPFPPK